MLFSFAIVGCTNAQYEVRSSDEFDNEKIQVGAERTAEYFPLLEGKRIAVVTNQTGVVAGKHLVDTLLQAGMDVRKVFAPEHGFRGPADAGALV